MKIVREKPSQRRHHRLTAPLYVSVQGNEPVLADDWSLGGLRLDNYDSIDANIADELELTLELPFQGYNVSFTVDSKVVRIEQSSSSIFFEFVDLSERSFDLMNHFAEALIRGNMATVDDMICRIDVPVTPISTSPTPNPGEEVPVHRLPIKTILMSGFYILLGIGVFGYLALLFYSSQFKLEVPSSVMASRVQTIKMPIEGNIFNASFSMGKSYNKGEEIFRFESNALTNKIISSRNRILRAENTLHQAKELYRIEQERLKLYQIVSATDTTIIKAQLSAKRIELNSIDQHFARLTKLKKLSGVSMDKIEDAKQQQNAVTASIKELEAKLAQATAMETASQRRHYNHKEFSVDLDMQVIKLQGLYEELSIEKQQLALLLAAQSKQVVRSPYNAKVINLFQIEDSTLSRNEPVLTLEENDQLTVSSFLNQEEIIQVGLHDKASVYIPSLGIETSAVVRHIDRSSSFIDKKESQYSWQNKKERTALVSLELMADQQVSPLISAGLPVVVIFDRRSTSNLMSKIFGRKPNASIPTTPALKPKGRNNGTI